MDEHEKVVFIKASISFFAITMCLIGGIALLLGSTSPEKVLGLFLIVVGISSILFYPEGKEKDQQEVKLVDHNER